MVRRFRGEGVQKVDGKGRVSIPAHYRRVLEAGDPGYVDGKLPEFVIVYGDERRDYLECFTLDAAAEMDARIERLPRGHPVRKKLSTLFNGQSMPATVDETGRIVLPAKLRQKIGITTQAYFIAQGDTFQIWTPEAHEAQNADIGDWMDRIPEGADEWALLEMVGED